MSREHAPEPFRDFPLPTDCNGLWPTQGSVGTVIHRTHCQRLPFHRLWLKVRGLAVNRQSVHLNRSEIVHWLQRPLGGSRFCKVVRTVISRNPWTIALSPSPSHSNTLLDLMYYIHSDLLQPFIVLLSCASAGCEFNPVPQTVIALLHGLLECGCVWF